MQLLLTPDTSVAIAALQQRLSFELEAGRKVLWLVSGGSNIDASVKIMPAIMPALRPKLTIMLSDERYGPIGHADSNYQQFLDKGFACEPAIFIPTLQPGLTLDETANAYAKVVAAEFAQADIIISQLGIGADGHIAGALPGTPATLSEDLVSGYKSDPYERITLTFSALSQINVNYSLVYGADKQTALLNLRDRQLPLTEQPAQILKQLPDAYVYNDQVGDIT